MARKGRIDRGLMQKRDARGKIVWHVRLYHHGREHRFGSFKTKTQARDFYEAMKQEQKEGRFFPERYHLKGSELVQLVFDKYLLSITTKKDQRTERYMAKWWGDTLKGRRLNQITVDALDTARQVLLAKGCTPQRVNRYMAWLRHVLNGAMRAGKLSSNPVTQLKMYKEPRGKTRFLSFEEEHQKLYPELGTIYAPWARLAILTGLRQEEQFTLRWSQIDLEQGLITLPTTKAGDCQYIPLNEEAITILRGLDSWKHSAWVFPSENPATNIDPRNFYTRVWVPAVKRAGIDWVTWHDLRHTFASRLAMNGAREGTIATLLRHSTTALVKRYAHLSPSHLKAAVEGVANFGRLTIKEGKTLEPILDGAGVSSGTVTQTGSDETGEVEEITEVVD